MYRSLRTILVLMLSLSMAWLPMQSPAATPDVKSDSVSQLERAVPCHGGMSASADDVAADAASGGTAHNCCCDGCDSSCDSGCMHGGTTAMLSPDTRLTADTHHAFQASVSLSLDGLTYSPPIPPPLV